MVGNGMLLVMARGIVDSGGLYALGNRSEIRKQQHGGVKVVGIMGSPWEVRSLMHAYWCEATGNTCCPWSTMSTASGWLALSKVVYHCDFENQFKSTEAAHKFNANMKKERSPL